MVVGTGPGGGQSDAAKIPTRTETMPSKSAAGTKTMELMRSSKAADVAILATAYVVAESSSVGKAYDASCVMSASV